MRNLTREIPKFEYMSKFLANFNKQGLKGKLIISPSSIENFSFNFFENFHKKRYFFNMSLFFLILSTYMFDFNEWGLKWKVKIPAIHFSKNKKPEKVEFSIFLHKTAKSLQSVGTYNQILKNVGVQKFSQFFCLNCEYKTLS